MSKKLEDFTVRVNLDGWHIGGFGTCWVGQEFHGKEILPRMVTAISFDEKFKFQGTMASVCVLRGGSIDELIQAFEDAGIKLNVPVKKSLSKPVPKSEPVVAATTPTASEEEVEEQPEDEEDEEEGEEEQKMTKKSSKKAPKRRPRSSGR